MANEWIASDNGACYVGDTAGYVLQQANVFTLGKLSSVSFRISNMTQGKLTLESMPGKPFYSVDGYYNVVGFPLQESLSFNANQTLSNQVFNGCISEVFAFQIPAWRILDSEGNTVLELTDESGVTSSGAFIQYQIDWSSLPEGKYYIVFDDDNLTYESGCFCLTFDTCKNIVLDWQNESSAYGFNFNELDFNPRVRLIGKKWKPNYPKEKDVFVDNAGKRFIISSRVSKKELLSIEEIPEYLHDSIAIGMEHDHFYINDEEYVVEEDDYQPKWRNTSTLATSETEVFKKTQNLKNSRCSGNLE